MDLELLREVVNRVLKEDVGRITQVDNVPTYVVDEDDFESILDDYNQQATKHGVKIYAPFYLRPRFASHSGMAELAKRYDFKTKDAAATLKKAGNAGRIEIIKHEYRPKKGAPGKTKKIPEWFDKSDYVSLFLACEERTRTILIRKMIDGIVRRFKSQKIEAVVSIDSSYGMAGEMANGVATALGVPVVTLEKISDPDTFDYDFKELEDWLKNDAYNSWKAKEKKRSSDANHKPQSFEDYIVNTLKGLDITDAKHIKSLLSKGDKPSIARDIDVSRRRFWNLFKDMPNQQGHKRVLVIDDNVDSGWTGYHANKKLVAVGMDPWYAVGYIWLRD